MDSQRPTTLEKYKGSLQQLGEEIGDLDYSVLSELFNVLYNELTQSTLEDEQGNEIIQRHIKIIAERLHNIISRDIEPLLDLCKDQNQINPKHPKTISGYDSIEELGRDIRKLDYTTLAQLMQILVEKFKKDAQADEEGGRPKIAAHIKNIATSLEHIIIKSLSPLTMN